MEGYCSTQRITARRELKQGLVDEALPNVEDMDVDPIVLLPQRSPSPLPRPSGRPNQ